MEPCCCRSVLLLQLLLLCLQPPHERPGVAGSPPDGTLETPLPVSKSGNSSLATRGKRSSVEGLLTGSAIVHEREETGLGGKEEPETHSSGAGVFHPPFEPPAEARSPTEAWLFSSSFGGPAAFICSIWGACTPQQNAHATAAWLAIQLCPSTPSSSVCLRRNTSLKTDSILNTLIRAYTDLIFRRGGYKLSLQPKKAGR